MVKALLFVYCLLLLHVVTWSHSLYPRHSSSRAITVTYYSQITFADHTFSYDKNGLVASYSNTTVGQVTGLFYEPGDPFTSAYCLKAAEKKRSPVYPPRNFTVPRQPFVAFLPLTSCDHYSLAQIAADYGAKGVLFHGATSGSSLTSYHATKLTIPVAYIEITDTQLAAYRDALDFRNTTITIYVRQVNSTYRTSQTFYFVVFAFTVLVLLSLVWFTITYIRRCHSYCSRRHTRRRERQETTRAITSLPTKKHKITKKSDTDSVNSFEEPTCAVCLEVFRHNEIIRPLPCGHEFHKICIDPWLATRGNCPLCKSSIIKRQTNGTHTVSVNHSRVTPSDVETIQLTSTDEQDEEEQALSEAINSMIM